MARAIATPATANTVTHEPLVGLRRERATVAEITGTGHVKDGRKCWSVASSRNPDHWYIVILSTDGSHLWCSCQAGRFGKPCRHKEAVSVRIARERAIAATAEASRLEEARHYAEAHAADLGEGEFYCLPTGKPLPAPAPAVAAQDDRETALMAYHSDTRPFSIWKA